MVQYTTRMIPFLHRWVSQRVLREAGFAPHVVAIVGETSRWTDWYRWTDTLANAATPTDSRGQPTMDPKAAAQLSVAIFQDYLRKIETSPLNEQYVWLGFALHWAQDLAAHQGRTDPEHTTETFLLLPNPDWSPRAVRRGLTYCRQLLTAIGDRLGPRWGKLQAGDNARLLTNDEATKLLGPRDFTWPNFWHTMLAFRHYFKTPKATRRIRWDVERILEEGLRK